MRQLGQQRPIDRGNPLTRGLVAVNDAAVTAGATRVGAPGLAAYGDRFGGGMAHAADASSMFTVSLPNALGSAVTMLAVCNVKAGVGATANNIVSVSTNGSGNQVFVFQSATTAAQAQGLIRVANLGGISTVQALSMQISATDPVFRVWTIVYDGTNQLKIYRDGVDDSERRDNTAASGAMTDMNNVSLGGINRGTDAFSNAGTGQASALAIVWDRALSAAEVKSISLNPWKIYSPRRRRLWAPAAPSFNPAWARGRNTILGAGAVL